MRIRRSTTELHPHSTSCEWLNYSGCGTPFLTPIIVSMRHVTGVLLNRQKASIAQWQSTGLVNQGSRVQSSLEARADKPYFLHGTSL